MELHQHQGDGIRYSMHLSAPKGGIASMICDPSGNWVSWEDYEKTKIEAEEYRLKLRDAGVEIYTLKSQVAFLIDEKESGRIRVEARLVDGMSEKNKEIARLKAELTDLKSAADRFKAEAEELKRQPDPLTAYLYAAELAKDTNKKQKAEIANLQAEVERLNTGIQPEGSNDAVGRAVNVLLEKEKEIARLKAEVERLTADLNKMTKTPDGVDYVEVDVGFWTKSGSRLPSSYHTFWSNAKGVQS